MKMRIRPVRIVRADLGPRGVWYRVLVGDFADRKAAEAYRNKLRVGGVSVGPIVRIEVEP
jgi:cell division protein FtsN